MNIHSIPEFLRDIGSIVSGIAAVAKPFLDFFVRKKQQSMPVAPVQQNFEIKAENVYVTNHTVICHYAHPPGWITQATAATMSTFCSSATALETFPDSAPNVLAASPTAPIGSFLPHINVTTGSLPTGPV